MHTTDEKPSTEKKEELVPVSGEVHETSSPLTAADDKGRIPSPREIQNEFQELMRKKFGNAVQVVAIDQQPQHSDAPDARTSETPTKKDFRFPYSPKQIVDELNQSIIGQDEAKRSIALAICDHYKHIEAEQQGDTNSHFQKQNVLLLGPTGVGKTFLVRSVAKMIGVPFVKADATRFSEVGFVGANVDDVIRDLVQQANGDLALAENGIVYIDEVDKIAGSPNAIGRDVRGRGVQFGLLRLLEDTEVDLNSTHDIQSQFRMLMNLQKKGEPAKDIVRTKNILFIFSGAFHDLIPIIKKRLTQSKMGIHSDVKTEKEDADRELLQFTQSSDLVEFGFEQEFIGRLPVVTSFHKLSISQLFDILKYSKASIIHQHVRSFKHYGIDLKFTDEALLAIAEKAFTLKTGARGLAAVCAQTLQDFKFELPGTQIQTLEVTPELIKNPKGYLDYLLNTSKRN